MLSFRIDLTANTLPSIRLLARYTFEKAPFPIILYRLKHWRVSGFQSRGTSWASPSSNPLSVKCFVSKILLFRSAEESSIDVEESSLLAPGVGVLYFLNPSSWPPIWPFEVNVPWETLAFMSSSFKETLLFLDDKDGSISIDSFELSTLLMIEAPAKPCRCWVVVGLEGIVLVRANVGASRPLERLNDWLLSFPGPKEVKDVSFSFLLTALDLLKVSLGELLMKADMSHRSIDHLPLKLLTL